MNKTGKQRRYSVLPRRFIALVLALAALTAFAPAASALPDIGEYSRSFTRQSAFDGASGEVYAEALERLGLFRGTGQGFELERSATRMEALVAVMRLMGVEEEALSLGLVSTFSDIPAWAADYAGYGERHGIVQGMGDGSFGASDEVTALQVVTMMLRVLGYDDGVGDFEYRQALSFAYGLGMTDEWELDYYSGDSAFTRGDMCYILYRTLYSERLDGEPLIIFLINDGAIAREDACATLERQGESEEEILRAVSNGFSEAWLESLHAAIEANEDIPEPVKSLFKQSVYNWLKEPGMDTAIEQIESKLTALVVQEKARSEDIYFSTGYAVAYFMSPNLIVLRKDMDLTSYASTVAHELRHAMTSSLYPTIMEEGFTELWSQEVDDGDYSYPYYYVNAAKLLTHLAGAEAANRADLTGSWEQMFYAVEKNTGVSFDKDAMYAELADLSDPTLNEKAAEKLGGQMLSIITAFCENKSVSVSGDTGSWQRFVDEIIILGQLAYYPSAVIQRAESDLNRGEPKNYYSGEFLSWAEEMLGTIAETAGVSRLTLDRYWQENYNTRLYTEYFGPLAGGVFEGGASAYMVYYTFDGYNTAKLYGDSDKAERFRRIVRADGLITVRGAGFAERVYGLNP